MIERFVLVFIAGFLAGSFMVMNGWEQAAKRGSFEIGSVVYRTEKMLP